MLLVQYLKSVGLISGTRMVLMPPSLALIWRQRLESIWAVVLVTFLDLMHCVAMPSTLSPIRFT